MNWFLQKSVLILLYGIAEAANHFFLALDEICYPSYRKVIIKSPLFVISMPRTGTTWLQNVLCTDKEQITSMKLWEMMFAPSIIQKKLFRLMYRMDARFNHFLTRKLRKLDARIFRDYHPIHPSSLFGYEDDDLVLLPVFSNLFLVFMFPKLKLYDFLIRFDHSTEEKRKKRVMSFYKKCIQKHLFVSGKEKIYFSKSASHIPKMQSLMQAFPDGFFIFTVRSPEQVVPSAISLYIRFSEIFHTPVDLKFITARTMKASDHMFSYPLEVFRVWPKERYFINRYEDLVENIEEEVTKIYTYFGLSLSGDFRKVLTDERLRAKSFKSAHLYSPEKWGITNEELNARYRKVYEQYIVLIEDEAKN